ncbi:ParA family protein [uncultured Vagococcus sp.]|uniref:ParA family protein n=1 Tax=uncultured Vagococcus sp. TaxID=189676 RepID=UPI00258F3EBF|nr:AAA family ATPase [uncultured Vagococcus sp.]
MAQIITFGNFKGGVGKTANSTMVAYELAKKGKRTMLIDLDPQGNATNIFLKTKFNISNDLFSFKSSLMSSIEEENLTNSIINITENLDLLASAPDFSLYPRYMEKISNYDERVKYFSTLIKPLENKYDYILIDIPPTISLITDSALYASDYCVIVMQTHEHSFDGAKAFLTYIQEEVIDLYKAPRLYVIGILAVLIQAGAPVDEATIINAQNEFGKENIFDTYITSMQRIKRYGVTGITEGSMHDTRVFDVYTKVTDELLSRINEVESYE